MAAIGQTVAAIMRARNIANVSRLRAELRAAVAAQAVTGQALARERAGSERETLARLKAWRAAGGATGKGGAGAAGGEVAGAGGVAGKVKAVAGKGKAAAGKGKAAAAVGVVAGAGGVAGKGKAVAAVGVVAGTGNGTKAGTGNGKVRKAALKGAVGALAVNSKRSWPSDVPIPEATRKRGRPDLRPDVCKQCERQAAGKPGGTPHASFCTKVKFARVDRP